MLRPKLHCLKLQKTGKAMFRFTGNQNITVGDITEKNKKEIDTILEKFNVKKFTEEASLIRKKQHCRALPLLPATGIGRGPSVIYQPLLPNLNLSFQNTICRKRKSLSE
jgi:hypothetical protein